MITLEQAFENLVKCSKEVSVNYEVQQALELSRQMVGDALKALQAPAPNPNELKLEAVK